ADGARACGASCRQAATASPSLAREWWQRFFESPDSIPLSYFPSDRETDAEVAGICSLLQLTRQDRVLDVCCGMGRHLVRLRARGYDVVGLDYSNMMLRRAAAAAATWNVACRLVRGDAARLPFRSGSFAKVVNLFNSFGYCLSDEDNERVIREASRCLVRGGDFLLETRNKSYQLAGLPMRCAVRLPNGRRYQHYSHYDRKRRRLNTEWTEDDASGRLVHAASVRLYEMAELKRILEEAGLRLVRVFGNYHGDPFQRHNRQLILLARKA
ncbi:MAG: class I SAM-dependent methyltransferase, partial [Armatimonadota bacterium]